MTSLIRFAVSRHSAMLSECLSRMELIARLTGLDLDAERCRIAEESSLGVITGTHAANG